MVPISSALFPFHVSLFLSYPSQEAGCGRTRIYTPTGFFDFLGMGNGIRDIAGGVRVFSHEIYLARKQNEQDYQSLRKLSLRIHSTFSMLTVILMSF